MLEQLSHVDPAGPVFGRQLALQGNPSSPSHSHAN